MPKLAIYVPKDEMKKIDRWRKKINFSRVFMRALAREIERQSSPAPDNDKLAAAAMHYGRELASDLTPIRQLGVQLGTADVVECRLTKQQVYVVLGLDDGKPKKRELACLEALKDHKKAIDATWKKSHRDESKHPGWKRELVDGYIDGVRSAWDEVCRVMNRDLAS